MAAPPPPPVFTAPKKTEKKKWEVVDATVKPFCTLDLSNEHPHPNIHQVEWSTLQSITNNKTEKVGSGAQITFAKVDNGVVVLKAAHSVGQEWMGSVVAKLCGAQVPKCRIIPSSSDEFTKIRAGVDAIAGADPAVEYSKSMFKRVMASYPALLIMEFVEESKSTPLSERSLRDIGALVVLDLLIINIDRFPLWKSVAVDDDGCNLGNIIVKTDATVVAIDQETRGVLGDFARYEAVLREAVDDLVSHGAGSGVVGTVFALLKGGFSLASEDEAACRRAIWEGIRQSFRTLLSTKDVDLCLARAKEECARQLGASSVDSQNHVMRSIDLEGLNCFISIFREKVTCIL